LIQCAGQPVLPVSLKDEMGVDTVKIYCPKCSQVFHPPPLRSSRATTGGGASGNSGTGTFSGGVDGAAFGTTFPHLFLMTFSNLVPDPLPPESAYVPRIFGFRVHKSSRQRFASTNPAALPGPTTATTSSSQMVVPTGNSNIDSRRDESLNYELEDDDDVSNINDDRKELVTGTMEGDDQQSSRSNQGEQELNVIKSVSNKRSLNDLMDLQTAVAPTLAESPQQDAFDRSDEDRPSSGGGVNTMKRGRAIPESLGGANVTSFFTENATKRRRRNNTNNATSNNA
jgi:Casein kinase II regulatory subunit